MELKTDLCIAIRLRARCHSVRVSLPLCPLLIHFFIHRTGRVIKDGITVALPRWDRYEWDDKKRRSTTLIRGTLTSEGADYVFRSPNHFRGQFVATMIGERESLELRLRTREGTGEEEKESRSCMQMPESKCIDQRTILIKAALVDLVVQGRHSVKHDTCADTFIQTNLRIKTYAPTLFKCD